MEETLEKPKKYKGGRPVKRIKRSNDIRVRLTNTELLLIKHKAKEARMTVSEWFRQAAKQAKVVARLSPEDLVYLRMLTGMANNLNQVTHLAHKEGLLSVLKRCRDILFEIDETLKKLNADDRES
jgi:hypothetical protein